MKTLNAGFASHIASGATTLATCWRLERRDGVVLGFTDHDVSLSFGGTDYHPAHGLDGSEAVAQLGPQVDTSEVAGLLHSEAITEDDIALGRYDGAEVQTWRVNWANVAARQLLRHDTIGEIVREDGLFRAELRSGQYALNVARGRIYSTLCDAELGDSACGKAVSGPIYTTGAGVVAIRDPYRIEVSGLAAYAPDWFGFGRARWTSGKRVGLTDTIGSHTRIGAVDVIGFDVALGHWLKPGDTLTVTAGCDRRFATCKAKFSNGVNFRGFPHIPGSDFVLRYPRDGETHDGRALFT